MTEEQPVDADLSEVIAVTRELEQVRAREAELLRRRRQLLQGLTATAERIGKRELARRIGVSEGLLRHELGAQLHDEQADEEA